MKLLENKKNRRIYEVIEDEKYRNILYIYISPEENINDLLSNKISKEIVMKNHCEPIKRKEIDVLFQMEESICKIKYSKIGKNNILKDILGCGFFLEMNINEIPFNKCLITNNHILDESYFKTNKVITIEYINKTKIIQIGKRRIYTNSIEFLDYTCIELFDYDNIKRFFNINSETLKNNINIFKDVI